MARPEVAVVFFLFFFVATFNTRMQRWVGTLRDHLLAVSELPDLYHGNEEVARMLGPLPDIAWALPKLERQGVVKLSVIPLPAQLDESRAAPPGAVDSVKLEPTPYLPGHGRCLRLAGWARSEQAGGGADEVWIVSRGVVLKRAWVGRPRPHAGADAELDPRPTVGWSAYLDTGRLSREDETLDVYALRGRRAPTGSARCC